MSEILQRINIKDRVVHGVIDIEIDPQTQAIVDSVERVMENK